jgi:hypothetical protein
MYSAVPGFWSVQLAEPVTDPTGCGEVARGGGLFVRNFNVTKSTVLKEAERRTRANMTRN